MQGQDIYDSKQVRDKQIIRIIGKAPTIAAAAYLRMAGRPPVLPSGSLSYAENFLYMLDSMYACPSPSSHYITCNGDLT